jgi:hypothetical protein
MQYPLHLLAVQCPKCHQMKVTGVDELLASERDEIPEGLHSVTSAQCQEMTCLHEFEVVTHRQILRSMANWSSVHSPSF